MNPPPPSPELRKLIDQVLDGHPLDRIQSAQLETLLADDQALDYYLQMTRQEVLLPRALCGLPPARRPQSASGIVSFPFQRIAKIAALIALGLGAGFLIGTRMNPETTPASADMEPSGARLTGLVGVEWENDHMPDQVSGGKAPDRLFFRTGLAELTYANGVRMTVEGPADLTITGPDSARVDKGKLVASVPKGAEGFTVDYEGGKVVDLGTEFAFSTGLGEATELGVFDGLVELHRPDSDVLSLVANQAIQIPRENSRGVSSIPFDREKFVRRIPTRDFRWHVTSHAPLEVEFDVSHLVWKSAEYRAVFKWMQGPDAIHIRDVTLLLDGEPVARNPKVGTTGSLQGVRDNIFQIDVPSGVFKRGRWTLRATLNTMERRDHTLTQNLPVHSVGIMQFEEGLVTQATAEDFLGTWRYHHEGRQFERTFFPDGSLQLTINGEPSSGPLSRQRWFIENGRLLIPIQFGSTVAYEVHLLRDAETLIFASNPYANAKKIRGREN